jgi:molybdopterin-containing oxidoreductase family iron-sulfur binding subunit
MIVNLTKCKQDEGCRECTEACHKAHNVPAIEGAKEEIKWIWKEEFRHAFPTQEHELMDKETLLLPVPVLCNHCEHPPCVKVCPTQATFRRDDGIVTMDMHRCIGCRYCIVACPYGARSFNWSEPWPDRSAPPTPDYPTRMRGVVEKCTFCDELQEEGKPPRAVCAEACPEDALVFGRLDDPRLRDVLKSTFTIRRKPGLGTDPHVFYVVS